MIDDLQSVLRGLYSAGTAMAVVLLNVVFLNVVLFNVLPYSTVWYVTYCKCNHQTTHLCCINTL